MASGFRPHKWVDNDARLMEDISEIKRALSTDKILKDFPSFKILGTKFFIRSFHNTNRREEIFGIF